MRSITRTLTHEEDVVLGLKSTAMILYVLGHYFKLVMSVCCGFRVSVYAKLDLYDN